MAMTSERWAVLAHDRAQQAKADPGAYRLRVAAWAVAGYAALLGALALTLGGVAGIVAAVIADDAPAIVLKLAIPIAVIGWVVVRSLFVKIPPPTGVRLRRSDAPVLFEAIDRLREQLGTPRLHRVLLDGHYNASVVQIPRLGPFLWQRNYLKLGLPIMQALAPEELEAVIAHELGHISRKHGRFGVWLYRVRSSWENVARQLDENEFWGAGIACRCYAWYVDRLDALSIALRREHEREADLASADAVGSRAAAVALVRMAAAQALVGDHWDRTFARAADEPAPPRDTYRALGARLRCDPGDPGRDAVMRELAAPTARTDSHPSLSERLAALGHTADGIELGVPATSAADALLGRECHTVLCDRVGGEWAEEMREEWVAYHAEAGIGRARLAALDERAAAGSLDLDAARDRARLVQSFRDDDAALLAWRDVLAIDAFDGLANLTVGCRLADRDDAEGLAHLDRAIAASPLTGIDAATVARDWLSARGRDADAARYDERRTAALDALNAAQAERAGLSNTDELVPHDLPPQAVAELSGALERVGAVGRAYVARKRVSHLAGDLPMYVIGVKRSFRARWGLGDGDRKLVRSVLDAVDLPGETLAVSLDANKWLVRRLRRIDGALVFNR